MGLFENLYNNIKDEIHYRNSDNFIGERMRNREINRMLENSSVNKRSMRKESAYDIERKAQDINGDANLILAKAEDRIDKSRKQMLKNLSYLREREIQILHRVDKEYTVNNKEIALVDQEFIAAIKRPAFYGEYDGEPFTIKGLFTKSYGEAEVEAERAMMIAKSNKAQAQAVSASVDAMLNHFNSVEELIHNELTILDNFEVAINESEKISTDSVRWLKELIKTTISDGNFVINEAHKNSLDKLKVFIK